MIRKFGLTLLALLLIGLPVSAALGKEAHAASSSRIAVIEKLSGDVQVQKAGGSKQFKAFAKLSLNQGDKLVTGSEGSAVLQFANGTSEDDKFTVGENATLTFSKLSDKKGTITKVSMLKGTAWVDVKSIKSKDDDFQLETPTAIMGVRGTAFFASVNPATGGTDTAVMSGVVRYTAGGALTGGNGAGGAPVGPSSGSGESRTIDLYPTQQISSEPGSSGPLSERTHIVDIENLVRGTSSEVIEALLRSKVKIDEENRQSVEAFKRSGVPDGLQQTLDQFIQLTQALLGVFAKQAVDQRKLELSTVHKIEQQESTSFDLTKDKLALSDVQLKQQEAAKQKQKEAAAKKAAEEAAAKQELEDKLAGQLKAIEASKQAQAEANRRISAEAAAKAEAALLGTLTPVQRQQYGKDKANHGTPAPTPLAGSEPTPPPDNGPGPTPPPGSNDARLKGLALSAGGQLSPAFAADVVSYSVSVGSGAAEIELTLTPQDPAAAVSVNGAQWKGGAVRVPLAYGDNEIKLAVTAPNGSATRVYTITATRHLLDSADIEVQGISPLHIDFTAANPATTFDVPSDANQMTLKLPLAEKLTVTVNGKPVTSTEVAQGVAPGFATSAVFTASPVVTDAAANTRTYSVPLQEGTNTIVIEAKVEATVKSYTLVANRAEAFRAEDGYAETEYNQPFTGKLKSRGGGGDVRYEIVDQGDSGGVVTLDATDSSSFTYTPAEDFSGVDSFSFKAIAGGIESAPATVVIRVKPLDIEVKGLVSSSIAWGEAPVDATYLSGYEDGSFKRKYYGLFVDDQDSRLAMHFVFDRAMVTDAQLIYGEDILDQAEDGSLDGDFALVNPVADVRLTFSAAFEDQIVSYEINYIVIRQQSWSAYLPTEGQTQVHLVPVKGGDYTVNVRGDDDKLLLQSNNFSTETASDVWIYKADSNHPGSPKERVRAEMNGSGYYEVPLDEGWNQAEVRTYFPGSEGSAQLRTVHIWRGDGVPEGYAMAGVQGTPVQYPPQASTAPKAFIRDESQQSVYRVALPSDAVAVDVRPAPGEGLKIDAVYQGGYTSFQRVDPYPEGSGRYQVQLYGDWNNFGFVVVNPVNGGGPPFAYTLDMETGLTLDVGANIFYKQGSQSAEVSLEPFEGGLQGILAGAPDQSGFELHIGTADQRASVWVNDILVPYNASGYYFAYPFAPEDGDNVFRIMVTDRYGRHGSLDVYLSYEAQEQP